MMDNERSAGNFGCEICWPSSAEAAWKARQSLARMAELVHSSHYHVMILICENCRQQYLSVFTESIDWIDGDDPQYWTLMPITASEADTLRKEPVLAVEARIQQLFPERRSLKHDYPKDEPRRSYWAVGF